MSREEEDGPKPGHKRPRSASLVRSTQALFALVHDPL
jgi:hypothetical protein